MDNRQQRPSGVKRRIKRKRFADGSAIVTYPDGSMLILESELAKPTVLGDKKPVSYKVPTGGKKKK